MCHLQGQGECYPGQVSSQGLVQGFEEGTQFGEGVSKPTGDRVERHRLDFRNRVECESLDEVESGDGCLLLRKLRERCVESSWYGRRVGLRRGFGI